MLGSQVSYQHRSPFTYQVTYNTTRVIPRYARVKGVFINDNGTLRKLDEVHVNDNGTARKIHQSVPTAQYQT